MLIEKDKLPKHMSFVLRSSLLDAAMRDASIGIDTTLRHVVGGIFLDAFFWPPTANAPRERVCVRAGAVMAPRARQARDYVESTVVPEFVSWLQSVLALPANSPRRREQQEFFRDFRSTG